MIYTLPNGLHGLPGGVSCVVQGEYVGSCRPYARFAFRADRERRRRRTLHQTGPHADATSSGSAGSGTV